MMLDKETIIKEIPLFAELSVAGSKLINERSELREYKKGDIIYEQGQAPSALYCLIVGRVMIYIRNNSGETQTLEYLHRGKYFGIISLLTNEPHSVTAAAVNDCLALTINKSDFDIILKELPSLAIDLSQTLSRRLKRRDLHEKTIFESTIISVFSSYSQAGKTIYAMNLALSLFKETHKSVVVLDIAPSDKSHTLPKRMEIEDIRIFDLCAVSRESLGSLKDFILKSRFGLDIICFHYQPQDECCVKTIVNILSNLVNDYHYLILDLPVIADEQVLGLLNQSDIIHLITGPELSDLEMTRALIGRLKEKCGFQEAKIKVIVNEYKSPEIIRSRQSEILNYNIFANLPKIDFASANRLVLDQPDCEHSKAIRRISRDIGNCFVGLVLGVGAGYGFCHVGVLKVIEEEKIPIDIIAGSSIGALIAGLWAIGKNSSEILETTKEFKEPKHIWGLIDLTFPILGFIKGNKLHRFLKKHFGNKTFYDTRLPLKIIASDVKHKEPIVLDKGLLIDAIMASCSMPGVFTPFKLKGEMLFDGGVINPLPTEPLLKMGLKKIIAVNVTPSREDIMRQYELLKEKIIPDTAVKKIKKRWFSLKEYFQENLKTNILEIIFSSIEALQSEVSKKEEQFADVVLHPDTTGLSWLELHRAREFALRGEEEARRKLDRIWAVINE